MEETAQFLGFARKTGELQFEQAQVAVERPAGSNKVEFYDVSDRDLLLFVEQATTWLRQKADQTQP